MPDADRWLRVFPGGMLEPADLIVVSRDTYLSA